VADLDAALPMSPATARSGPQADWEQALSAWACEQLASGTPDIHADARARMDRALLDAALAHTDGHRGEAASKLGLGRNTVTRKLGAARKPR